MFVDFSYSFTNKYDNSLIFLWKIEISQYSRFNLNKNVFTSALFLIELLYSAKIYNKACCDAIEPDDIRRVEIW